MLVLLLQLILVTLRLDCIVDWPWILVLSPTFVTIVGFMLFGPPFVMNYYEVDPDELEEEPEE